FGVAGRGGSWGRVRRSTLVGVPRPDVAALHPRSPPDLAQAPRSKSNRQSPRKEVRAQVRALNRPPAVPTEFRCLSLGELQGVRRESFGALRGAEVNLSIKSRWARGVTTMILLMSYNSPPREIGLR